MNRQEAWQQEAVHIRLPKELTAVPLADRLDTVAFMDGPVVLAGVLGYGDTPPGKDLLEERTLLGDGSDPSSILIPDNVREWDYWRGDYRTRGQPVNIQFVPLYAIRDERYGVYFPVKARIG